MKLSAGTTTDSMWAMTPVDADSSDDRKLAHLCGVNASYFLGRFLVLTVVGTVDTRSVRRMEAAARPVTAGDAAGLIIDLCQAGLAEAGGICAVGNDAHARAPGRVGFVGGDQLRKRLEAVGLEPTIAVWGSMSEAMDDMMGLAGEVIGPVPKQK
jgi:hypothetical protein